MNIVYMGTPDFSVFSLERLSSCEEINIDLVVTQPDKPRGRGHNLQATPIKKKALELNLEVYQTKDINTVKFTERLNKLKPDFIVVVAFGQKLNKEILDLPKYGCINLHGSLLPEYRGASPIHQAILDGRDKTGVTTMYMAEGWDTGDMIYKKELMIDKTDTVGILHDKLAVLGGELLVKTLINIKKGIAPREKQDDTKATYTQKIDKSTGKIDWNSSAEEIYNQVRGTNPWPGSYTKYHDEVIKIWQVSIINNIDVPVFSNEAGTIIKANSDNGLIIQTGDGFIRIDELQIASRKKMAFKELIHGYTIKIGERLK